MVHGTCAAEAEGHECQITQMARAKSEYFGTETQDPRVLNKPALHCMHHGFKPVVRAEFLVDAVKVIS
jgi:hypothetical protein